MVKFTKTRILYYQNNASNLNDAGIRALGVLTFPTNVANKNYKTVEVPADSHNWHQIPTDVYGYYMSEAELYSLYANFECFRPKSINVTIGHTLPLATFPGTSNTTQTSFNNCIYSLLYKLIDDGWVTCQNRLSGPNVTNFCRTFDGSGHDDNKRLDLPKPTLLYKIPSSNRSGDQSTESGLAGTVQPSANIQAADLEDGDLKVMYYPQFLLDNENVKVLYPGENQDVYEYADDKNPYAEIDCHNTMLGEMFQNLDQRAFGMNSNLNMPLKQLLRTQIYPITRGPVDQDLYEVGNGNNVQMNEWEGQLNGKSFDSYFSGGAPKWFVKGVPLLDSSGNLITHTFCCVITWTLEVEGTPNKTFIPRPLGYGYCTQRTTRYGVGSGGTPQQLVKQTFRQTWPEKPTHQRFMRDSKRRFKGKLLSKVSNTDYLEYDPHISPNNDDDSGILNNEVEVNPNYWLREAASNLPTNVFMVNETVTPAAVAPQLKRPVIKPNEEDPDIATDWQMA